MRALALALLLASPAVAQETADPVAAVQVARLRPLNFAPFSAALEALPAAAAGRDAALMRADISDLQQAMAAGEVTSEALTLWHLARIWRLDDRLRGMLFWLMGDAGVAAPPAAALWALAIGVLVCVPLARDLNLLARGDLTAQTLGVPVLRLRLAIYLIASALTAVAVTTVGAVGFVGLVVPHLMRLALGNDQRLLLPASALAGALLLLLADTAARTVIAPAQLPVGVLTALLGVPVFLFLLHRRQ